MSKAINIDISKAVGKGYKDFIMCKSRYRVVKGSRGSKKSTTAAQDIILKMTMYPLANTLVVRKTFNSHKDSTWTQLKWAANNLGVADDWSFSKSPLEATRKSTGQKILFRGLDDPMAITSITVEHGYLCWAWFEEAFQIMNEDDFNKVDMSIRGQLPDNYYKQITITFNPWSEKHWLKKKFFDNPDHNIMALTTTYKCNEWLGSDDISLFEQMKITNPRRYNIEGLGNWGIAEGLVYNNFIEQDFNYMDISKRAGAKAVYGLDFGYTNDPTAFIAAIVDEQAKELYIFDEYYQKAMTNEDIANMIKYKGYTKETIIADSAEPKSIDDIKSKGIIRIKAAAKGKDSILNGIQKIQDYKIIIHPKCENFLIEINNYVWSNKNGTIINKPIDDFNHLQDALRYAMESIKPSGLVIMDKSVFSI